MMEYKVGGTSMGNALLCGQSMQLGWVEHSIVVDTLDTTLVALATQHVN